LEERRDRDRRVSYPGRAGSGEAWIAFLTLDSHIEKLKIRKSPFNLARREEN
jgi:hypothetical protein